MNHVKNNFFNYDFIATVNTNNYSANYFSYKSTVFKKETQDTKSTF
jgi:hypothetical protein